MMYRKFITLVAAASIAITGLTAAPARAGNDDVAKIIAGVAVLAIIGAAIASNNDRDDNGYGVTRSGNYNNGYSNNGYRNNGYRNNRFKSHNQHNGRNIRRSDIPYYDRQQGHNTYGKNRGHNNRPLTRQVNRKLLPRSCKVEARTRNGQVSAYGRRCLNKNFRYAGSLPNQCAFDARTRRDGPRHTVYGRNCLANHGYRPGNY